MVNTIGGFSFTCFLGNKRSWLHSERVYVIIKNAAIARAVAFKAQGVLQGVYACSDRPKGETTDAELCS